MFILIKIKHITIWHYDKTNPFMNYKDFDPDIDIDLSYVNPDKHIKMVYNDIKQNIKIAMSINLYLLVTLLGVY